MFSFFKRSGPKPRYSDSFYESEYLKRRKKLESPFLEHLTILQDQLVCAVSVLDKEFNTNGGCNWQSEAYSEYIEVLQSTLSKKEDFTEQELEKINWAITEIQECGRELEKGGESARDAESAIYYLRDRSIDWILSHKEPIESEEDDEYIGHY